MDQKRNTNQKFKPAWIGTFDMVRILYIGLAIVSFGFYVHPACAFENPAHPRSPEEIQAEDDENHPSNRHQRKQLDEIDPDHAPHSEEDRKNWADKD